MSSKPPYHWIFKIDQAATCSVNGQTESLVEVVLQRIRTTQGVTYRPKKRQGRLVVIGADLDYADTSAELMLRLGLPPEALEALSKSAKWGDMP